MYERTYRNVLVPGFFPSVEEQNQHKFTNVIAVINNVDSRAEATAYAEKIMTLGEIDKYIFVFDHIDQALEKTGLTYVDLGVLVHFNDWALAGAFTARSPWLVNWDAEIRMIKPMNWIDPSIEFLSANSYVFVASPNPNPDWVRGSLTKQRTMQLNGNFATGYSFSDQVFLGRTKQFASPIYKEKCLASLRFPLAYLGSTFEKRIDSYMRNNKIKRAIYIPAEYRHPEETIGLGYPKELSKIDKFKIIRNEYIHRKLRNRNIIRLLRLFNKEHLAV
jgi:hypothetical protein